MMGMVVYALMLIPVSFMGFWVYQFALFIYMLFFLFTFSFSEYPGMFSFFMGLDSLGFLMVGLSIWVCSLMVLASRSICVSNFYSSLFLIVLSGLLLSLVFTFSSWNMFIFYFFFEVSLIPTLMLILGWGYQPERLQAGVYMFFYTIFGSLPMMVGIFYFYLEGGTLDFCLLMSSDSLMLYVCMVVVFLIKLPMFLFHLWLPKAHVEAPVSGSMILAGVMLKLGGYGFIRLMPSFLSVGVKFNYLLVLVSLYGGLVISLVCLRQSDIKSLVAYSSVCHMGLVLGGIMTMNYWGLTGAMVLMIGHGLCSSGLFCLANITYERLGSRSLFLTKGLINLMPSMSMWWFLLCSSNMAAPPSLNLAGEIMLINSIVSWGQMSIFFIMVISFFSAGYSLYLYSFSQHGSIGIGGLSFNLGQVREFLLMFLHWVPLNLIILVVDSVL